MLRHQQKKTRLGEEDPPLEFEEEVPDVILAVVCPFKHASWSFLVEEKTSLMVEVKKKGRISCV